MSSGKNLQEMEVGTKQVRDAVNSKAVAGMSMQSSDNVTPGQTGSYEDLGGPTPENYRPDDDSAKLNTPGGTLKQVKDVVNAKAKPAMAAPAEEVETEEPVIEEETTDEVVAEEETTESPFISKKFPSICAEEENTPSASNFDLTRICIVFICSF